jgi:FlaA1/EpsC-like NDP-sugar epimerase
MSVFPLAGIRVWRDCMRVSMQILERRILLEKPKTMRVLVYGGGLRFRSYLRELAERAGRNDRVIIGIIDDDLHLKGRIIAGHKVLGGFKDIGEWVVGDRIEGLIITSLLTPERQAEVVKTMQELGVWVSVWACDEVILAGPTPSNGRRG